MFNKKNPKAGVEAIDFSELEGFTVDVTLDADNIAVLQNMLMTIHEHPKIVDELISHSGAKAVRDTSKIITSATQRLFTKAGYDVTSLPKARARLTDEGMIDYKEVE